MKFGVWTELLFQKAFYLMSKEDAGAALLFTTASLFDLLSQISRFVKRDHFSSRKKCRSQSLQKQKQHMFISLASKFMEGRDPF